ncbi:MAG TPA: ABC transporter permease [Gammaproteobacteria bacterium]|nr:ABC transporter permease [Gammaproteobacteria bacterium]
MLAFRALRRNALRSGLTMLGIVIGVAAVIAIVTLGNGASARVSEGVSSLGERLLFVNPGADVDGPQRGLSTRQFSAKDVDAIARDVSGVLAVSPSVSSSVTAVYGNNHWPASVTGVTGDYFSVRNATLIRGAEFTAAQYQSGKLVCIIGKTVREELFGASDPVGASIRVGTTACPVVGELQSKGQSNFGNDQDNVILAPLRAVQSRLVGTEDVSSIGVSVAPWATNAEVKENIAVLLRERRNVGPNDADNFQVMDLAEVAGVLADVTGVLTLFLGAIAAVSLLVGGIGIMNIMLVSVTERTREIGIRLAIGAMETEVLAQFLVEAVILTTVGGAIGVAIGLGGSYVASNALSFPFVVSPTVIAVAFVFSALIGVIFGFVPARRAARLDPIEALRHE